MNIAFHLSVGRERESAEDAVNNLNPGLNKLQFSRSRFSPPRKDNELREAEFITMNNYDGWRTTWKTTRLNYKIKLISLSHREANKYAKKLGDG